MFWSILCSLTRAAVTKCRRLGGWETEIYFSLFWRLKVQDHVQAELASPEASFPVLQTAACFSVIPHALSPCAHALLVPLPFLKRTPAL